MFCRECGRDNLDRAEFCAVCGVAMGHIVDEVQSLGTPTPGKTPSVGDSVTADSAVDDRSPTDSGSTDESPGSQEIPPGHREGGAVSLRRIAGWVMVTGGVGVLILAAVGLFNAVGGSSGVVSRPSTGATASSELTNGDSSAVFAPDLIGLTEPAAVVRLQSLGISQDRITITQDSRIATAEIVVDQVPRSGEIVTDTIVLTVAIPVHVMPDVVGLDREIAMAVTGNAGLDSSSVSIAERPYSAPTGLVLSQSPPGGTVAPAGVLLVVATVVPAPNLTGETAQTALELLEPYGAEVDFISVELLDTPPDTIVAQSIAPGDPVTGPIELTIVVEPPATSLVSQTAINRSRCYVGDVEIDDVENDDELYCQASESRDASTSYELAGQFIRLRFSAHVTDRSSAPSGTVEIIGDGSLLQRISVTKVNGEAVDLDIRSAATLELRVLGDDVQIAFLDARVYAPTQSSP